MHSSRHIAWTLVQLINVLRVSAVPAPETPSKSNQVDVINYDTASVEMNIEPPTTLPHEVIPPGQEITTSFDIQEEENSNHFVRRDIATSLNQEGIALLSVSGLPTPNITLWCTSDASTFSYKIDGINPKYPNIAVALITSSSNGKPVPLTAKTTMAPKFGGAPLGRTVLSTRKLFVVASNVTCGTVVGQFFVNGTFPYPCTANTHPSLSYLSAKIYYVKGDSSVLTIGTQTTILPPIICNPHADPNCLTKEQDDFLPSPEWYKAIINPRTKRAAFARAIGLKPSFADNSTYQSIDDCQSSYVKWMTSPSTFSAVNKYAAFYKGNSMEQTELPSLSAFWSIKGNNTVFSGSVGANGTITNTMLQAFIKSKVAARAPGFTSLNPTRENIIAIHLSSGFQVTYGKVGTTCVNLCGFHDVVNISSTPNNGNVSLLYYTVVPYPNNSTCKGCLPLAKSLSNTTTAATAAEVIDAIAGHELLEVLTRIALGENYTPGLAEIADPCSWQTQPVSYQLNHDTNGLMKSHRLWDPAKNNCTFGSQYVYVRENKTMTLTCPPDEVISKIAFASFGRPSGFGPFWITPACHSPNSYSIIYNNCIGKNVCDTYASRNTFTGCNDPWMNLKVEYDCE